MKPSGESARRIARRLALACATGGLLLAPSTALATGGWSAPTQITPSTAEAIEGVSCASAALCLATQQDTVGEDPPQPGRIQRQQVEHRRRAVARLQPFGLRAGIVVLRLTRHPGQRGARVHLQGLAPFGGPTGVVGAASKSPNSPTCTSSAFCVALDGDGAYIDNNGTWTEEILAATYVVNGVAYANHLVQVSCGSPSFCVAVAISGMTGSGGYAYSYNGSSWSAETSFDTNQVSSVSCAPGS